MRYVLVLIVAVELLARGIPVVYEGWTATTQLRAMAKAPRCEDVVVDVLQGLVGEIQ